MENRLNHAEFDTIIVSRARSFASRHLYNTRVVDAEDLIQEGRVVYARCLRGFEKERYEYEQQEEAFRFFFFRALKNTFITINDRIKKHTYPNIDDCCEPGHEDISLMYVDFAENVKKAAGEEGLKYMALSLNPSERMQNALVDKSSTFREHARQELGITGRRCTDISRKIQRCACQ